MHSVQLHSLPGSFLRIRHKEESICRFQATLLKKREPRSHLQRLDLNGLCPTLRAGTDFSQRMKAREVSSRGLCRQARSPQPSWLRLVLPEFCLLIRSWLPSSRLYLNRLRSNRLQLN